MSWTNLLANNAVQSHKTSKKELDSLRSLIARDLADAAVAGLSADRRFATAYNAALQTAKMAIACAGYRVSSRSGDHQISIEPTKLALGKVADSYADYFDMCRRKRNLIDYTDAHVATESETDEIVRKANEFLKLLESWISANYPFLKA